MAELNYARYGKDNIRLYKVEKGSNGVHTVVEMTVCVLLEGDIETSYTQADNSVVVATDTQKQTTYLLAKQHPVTPIETFAATLGNHFVTQYPHIHGAWINITQLRWTRMNVDGKPHPHSFLRDGADVRTVEVHVQDGGRGITVKAGLDKLLVLKSTGSAFYGFHRDEYTRLPEVWDRILSTEVKADWTFKTFSSLDEVLAYGKKFETAAEQARTITLATFAKDASASVQNTMFKMCQQILDGVQEVDKVEYSLPNKHYFEIDMSWFKGLKNTGKDAEVFAPQSDPNGLIQCVVTRKGGKSRL